VALSPETVPLAELDTLWDFDDPAGSERRFEIVVRRARLEDESAFLAEALTQLARAQGLQRRFDDATRTLDSAAEGLRPQDRRGCVRLLLERGRVANSSGAGGRGRESFLEAWALARAAEEDGLAVDAAHMLGIVEPPDEAWAWNERAMELARNSPDPAARRWVGSLANNMGWARHDDGDDDAAIELFELARDEWLADGRVSRARIARWSIARCRRSQGELEAALGEQQAVLAELDELGETDGYVFEEIGECLLALGRVDEAQAHFAHAVELLADDPSLADDPERLERLRSLARADDQTEP
jgi:tetratricopeptide (TPR) repeat protein